MDKALRDLELTLMNLWNKLYEFLCGYFGVEVNEDWLLTEDDAVLVP